MAKSLPTMQEAQEMQVRSLGREDPLEDSMATTLVFLSGEPHGNLAGCGLQGHKESDKTEVILHVCTCICVHMHTHTYSLLYYFHRLPFSQLRPLVAGI